MIHSDPGDLHPPIRQQPPVREFGQVTTLLCTHAGNLPSPAEEAATHLRRFSTARFTSLEDRYSTVCCGVPEVRPGHRHSMFPVDLAFASSWSLAHAWSAPDPAARALLLSRSCTRPPISKKFLSAQSGTAHTLPKLIDLASR